MNLHSHIVEGGGWITLQTVGRKRARLFGLLTGMYLPISAGALAAYAEGWPVQTGSFEWFCAGALVVQLVLAAMALFCLINEKPRTMTEHRRSPDYDMRKLY
jgi:hypothetical protein